MRQAASNPEYFANDADAPDIRTQDEAEFLARCRPELEALEVIRLEKLKLYQFRKKVSIPLAVMLTPPLGWLDYWFLMLQGNSDDKAAGITALFLGGLYWWVTQPRRQYAKEYKIKILPRIISLFGKFVYDVAGCINLEAMKLSKIMPAYSRHESEDCFRGEYKGANLEFCELKLKQRRKSGKRSQYVTVFRGLAILIDLKHKRFLGHTVIDQNRTKIGQWFEEKTSSLKRANMVDPEFEKLFDVYTNDQVEARWLVDPVMIEKLKGLYEEYKGDKMAAAYYDNKMLALISSKHNHFEPASLETPATDPESILSMKREIGQVLSIIDKLDLYDPRKAGSQA